MCLIPESAVSIPAGKKKMKAKEITKAEISGILFLLTN
ncbi:hypothetical protein LEP1GSC161_3241 [Leptospira santarosai str. CBC1416]|uniref:Uncharacterized protein n=3 Tax=Leptospira santarosai TaxID=28183 RepID=A0A0E2BH18_9LEPT|nr:hypothetical protein LEP1GSC179_1885 [Leptospira santarosai str. MOR084]EMJ50787.1 hypothetical protein LEP1GSC169_3474 [Leptospira santarosai str. HAI1349]EMN23160.1 hypothetical protein LEP1GSC063_2601 [Leptospira santarosai serovar Arenal str. MAVJ 401]EMO59470.1 hypothetical protein LEP1GSC161_3241 [Leptospira santarosai str. CBC1416]EMP81992.1 hypothetical protein LEP1GSC162_0151 [Leptospira santarosai str. CBC1531]